MSHSHKIRSMFTLSGTMNTITRLSNFLISAIFKIIMILLLSACNFPGIEIFGDEPPPPLIIEETTLDLPEVEMVFLVKVPEDTPSDQPILMSFLDEVTGLAINAQRYKMEKLENGVHKLILPLSVGSTLKYRYSRQDNLLAEEHQARGKPVRYRMLYVTTAGEINDMVARWNDTLYIGTTGRITGEVLSKDLKQGIPGLLVTIGGSQTFTDSFGKFNVGALPPGTHNLVVYSIDGSYQTFQQGATIAAESSTPAKITLTSTASIDVTFLVDLPEDTIPGVPIRIAGNLLQLGNTYANLSGGMSTIASRMPALAQLPDGRYGIILSLPSGIEIRYKYTIGDGFWNAERSNNGGFVIRKIILPDTPVILEDHIETWSGGDPNGITFDLTVPMNTPVDETISIQFHPYGWTEPLPMWKLSDNRWAYILLSPLDLIDQLGYRYCRADQCGQADDLRTIGDFSSGKIVMVEGNSQVIKDTVDTWVWMEKENNPPLELPNIKTKPDTFIRGIELQHQYHPSYMNVVPQKLQAIQAMGANRVILTPSLTLTSNNPPLFEVYPHQDILWKDLVSTINIAHKLGLSVALKPIAKFNIPQNEWWAQGKRDFAWWVSWFDQYHEFVMNFAKLAEDNDVDSLIIDGEWLLPSLPNGTIDNGSFSGVPADVNERWEMLFVEINQIFSGSVSWSLNLENISLDPYSFLENIDEIYLLWSSPLATDPETEINDLRKEAQRILRNEVVEFRDNWIAMDEQAGKKTMILGVSYPSVEYAYTDCLPDPIVMCISAESLNYPSPDLLLELDERAQLDAYSAMMLSLIKRDWIDGFVSRGYYLPAELIDKSTSIHGKAAEALLEYWFAEISQ